jgi:hypothetical protein
MVTQRDKSEPGRAKLSATQREQGSVERATRRELRRLEMSVTDRGSAALAVALARQIDTARGAVAAAAAAGQLRVILQDLTELAESLKPERTALDELRERRYGREGGSAASS